MRVWGARVIKDKSHETGRRRPRGPGAITIIAVLAGLLLGIGLFTFHYAEGFSYLSTDPEACVNCHIMRPQYDSWQKSSHHAVAKCVDCHLPHDFVGKYIAKAENGYHHSKGFTFQDFHEPIMIKPKNAAILQANCLECHGELVHDLVGGASGRRDEVQCVHCHAGVGHGETTGLGGAERAAETRGEAT
jgi:cytochrome c nitrite reductase small subunit